MLEQKIELLTAAVETLTKAIGGMQAPGPVEKHEPRSVAPEKKSADVAEQKAKPAPTATESEQPKSEDTSSTSRTSAPESKPVSYDDVKRATNAVSKISREKAIAGLARFGVSSATKLTEQQWPGYVDYMTKVAAGEIDPEASHG
jgi:hypothetical protein